MTVVNLLPPLPQLFLDSSVRWAGTFLRVSVYKHLVLDILKSLFNAWLFISVWMCPLWPSSYQTVWLLTSQTGKHTFSSTTWVAPVPEGPDWMVLSAL